MQKTLIHMTIILFIFSMVTALSSFKEDEEWISIFDGKTLDGWTPKIKRHKSGENFNNLFRVEDGVIKVSFDKFGDFDEDFGHLFYKEELSHYRIRFDYRFTGEQAKGGPGWAIRNSGIMLHGQHPATMGLDQKFPVSHETQLLGGNGKDLRPTANVCSPGTHYEKDGELITTHCINSTSKTYHGDQWVRLEVEVRGNDVIRHYINDELVFEVQHPQLDPEDPDAKALLDKGFPLQLSKGYISLQAESHPVEFKNIELMKLKH